jgi:hypothetical protein
MRRSGATWTTVGLVVLAVLAVGLAFAALRSTSSGPAPAPGASALESPNEEQKSDKGKPNVTPSMADALPEMIEPPLLMVDRKLAYRGGTGTCLGGASLDRTTNGGNAWRPLEVPAEAILDIRTTGVDSVELIGADDRCRVRLWASADQGNTWAAPTPIQGIFVRLPDTTRDILTPSGTVKSPCPDRDIAPLAVEEVSPTEGVVLCSSGEVLTSADSGVTWESRPPVIGAQAIAFEGPLLGWVLVRDGGRCPGLETQVTQDGGTAWEFGGCVGETPIEDDRELPSLSFASPTEGWADLAGQSYLSLDGGLTWQLPS